uniref:RGS domain-containing protein n=1 Tax=Macrostomum lignano TaxID=282301 RepID=A0A1I8FSP0_9PLAT
TRVIFCRGTSRLERGFADVYAEGFGCGGSGGGGGGGTCRELLFQFQRFLQRRGQRHLLQFCFDADSFKAACGSRCSAANTGLTALAESGGPSETSVADNPSSRVAERLRKLIESDAVSLYKAYLAPEANPKLPIDDAIKVQIVEAMCSDNESHCIQPNTFDAARQAVYSLLADQLYNEFLSSPILAEYQLDFLSNRLGELNISDIVYCSSLVFNFMEYMDSLGASRFLQFLFYSCAQLRIELGFAGSRHGSLGRRCTLCLYDRYFSLQATYPLGFDDQFRVEVEIALCPANQELVCGWTASSARISAGVAVSTGSIC